MVQRSPIASKAIKWVLSLLFIAVLFFFSYYLQRASFILLITAYTSLFAIYLFLLHPLWDKSKDHFLWIVMLAISARLLILFSIPNLSDDYFRFIWDSRLFQNGINPYDWTPRDFMTNSGVNPAGWEALFGKLNSPDYYSIYPPINQLVFYLGNALSPDSVAGAVWVMKLVLFLAEMMSIVLIYKLCVALTVSTKNTLWYALNPLVIIEFTGNLHFEALLIPFLLASILLLIKNKVNWSALAFAGAVLAKLHPLMLLPFFIKYLGWKNGFRYAAIVMIVCAIFFSLFLFPIDLALLRLENMLTSFRLYFQNFEFNASIYYIFRWIGFQFCGFNTIEIVGKLMIVLNMLILIWLFLKMRSTIRGLIGVSFMAYFAYTLLATTVHPWYILPILPLALLSNYKTIIAWTGLIMLSYFAYSQPYWHENFFLLSLEYTFIFALLIYEFKDRAKLNEIIL